MQHHNQHKSVNEDSKTAKEYVRKKEKPELMASIICHLQAYFQSMIKPLLCFALLQDHPLQPLFIFHILDII